MPFKYDITDVELVRKAYEVLCSGKDIPQRITALEMAKRLGVSTKIFYTRFPNLTAFFDEVLLETIKKDNTKRALPLFTAVLNYVRYNDLLFTEAFPKTTRKIKEGTARSVLYIEAHIAAISMSLRMSGCISEGVGEDVAAFVFKS